MSAQPAAERLWQHLLHRHRGGGGAPIALEDLRPRLELKRIDIVPRRSRAVVIRRHARPLLKGNERDVMRQDGCRCKMPRKLPTSHDNRPSIRDCPVMPRTKHRILVLPSYGERVPIHVERGRIAATPGEERIHRTIAINRGIAAHDELRSGIKRRIAKVATDADRPKVVPRTGPIAYEIDGQIAAID